MTSTSCAFYDKTLKPFYKISFRLYRIEKRGHGLGPENIENKSWEDQNT